MIRKVEISYKTVVFTCFFIILLWFVYLIKDIILIFFISLLVMAILHPTVKKLSKFKIPRPISVFVVYVLVFGLLSITVAGIIPPLVEQTTNFANGLPKYLSNLRFYPLLSDQVERQIITLISEIPSQLIKVSLSVFSNILAVLTVLIFAFYLLLARDRVGVQISTIFGDKRKKDVEYLIDTLEKKLGGWARGELFLMTIIGSMSFVGFTVLGIPYALPLALIAGLLEIVPNIGPIVAAIPAAIIGFGISPFTGFAVIAFAFLIQQFEGYVFVPKIMEKQVGVSPIITLLALSVGFRLAGVIGILISVPVYITIKVLLDFYLSDK